MQLIMYTPCSKIAFDLDPDEVGELVQAAFRYASGMAQLQPGWSDGIVYQDGMETLEESNVPTEEGCQGENGFDTEGWDEGAYGNAMESE